MSSILSTSSSEDSLPPARVHSRVLNCKWEECSSSFTLLNDLVNHLHEDHVGRKKANYTCEWVTCPRKSATQTSRFALITHLRSHTGEKPYDCKEPGCEKSFTRPDSLTKHMKSQHGDSSKKHIMEDVTRTFKKRKLSLSPEEDEEDSHASNSRQPHYNNQNNNILRNRQQSSHQSFDRSRQQSSRQSSENPQNRDYTSDGDSSVSEASNSSSSSVENENQKSFYEKYLLLKAKHRYIRKENELLSDEYEAIKKKLKRLRTEKDILLDAVMSTDGEC
ncbi:hypothetical protein Glove_566g88 [Diversispora epigaea]|uniref:C2H2-type domain-containing protein n=1 Tax=Diversispora epigaea TaxID=1348612 RepID=A0A397GEN1_9GLOM|nr:hypothetical protein Glove_566g88 [Diversispora epigaea]